MNFLRFCLKIIGVLLVVFLATGLFIKETSYEVDVKIRKKVPEIFGIFSDQSDLMKWNPEIVSVKGKVEKKRVVGSEYEMLVVNNKDTLEIHEKVIAYVPNKKTTLLLTINELLKTDDYTFRYIGGLTIITKNVSCESESYLMMCLLPYIKYYLKEIDQKQLDRFKNFIES